MSNIKRALYQITNRISRGNVLAEAVLASDLLKDGYVIGPFNSDQVPVSNGIYLASLPNIHERIGSGETVLCWTEFKDGQFGQWFWLAYDCTNRAFRPSRHIPEAIAEGAFQWYGLSPELELY